MARVKTHSRRPMIVLVKRRRLEGNGDASTPSLPIEDRISSLPRGVIGSILERLSTYEVARTSVLSRTWKRFWETHHKLILDRSFYQRLLGMYRRRYLRRVNDILTIHDGRLQRFEFYFKSHQSLEVDLFILTVSRKHIQELVLTHDYKDPDTNYRLPSYLYLCEDLTYLQLNHFCMRMQPPLEFKGFPKLRTLVLELFRFSHYFGEIVTNLPNLETMSLTSCRGLQYIDRLPKSLRTLIVRLNADFDWSMFRHKTSVTTFVLKWSRINVSVRPHGMEKINLMMFLDNIPSIESLSLDGPALNNLARNVHWNRYINGVRVCACELKTLIIWDVDFRNLETVTCLVSLLRSTCNLQNLEIGSSFSKVIGAEAAVQYVRDVCEYGEDMKMKKLQSVSLRQLNSLHTEKYLLQLLYAQTPSLTEMNIEFRKGIGMMRRDYVLEEITNYPRASSVERTHIMFRTS